MTKRLAPASLINSSPRSATSLTISALIATLNSFRLVSLFFLLVDAAVASVASRSLIVEGIKCRDDRGVTR